MNGIISAEYADLSIFVWIFVLVFVVIGALKGLKLGMLRQGLKIASLLISIIASVLIVGLIYNGYIHSLDGMTTEEVINSFIGTYGGAIGITEVNLQDIGWISDLEVDVAIHIFAIPFTLLILPIIFVILFVVIRAILDIVCFIITKFINVFSKKKGLVSRLVGMALGILQGIVVSAMLLMPIIGIGHACEDASVALRNESFENSTSKEVVEVYDNFVAPTVEGVPFRMLGFFGANAVYKNITTVSLLDKEIDMTTLIPDSAKIYANIEKCSGMDMKDLSDEEEMALRHLVGIFEGNDYFMTISAEIIDTLATTVSKNGLPFELEEPYYSFVSELVLVFTGSTADTVHEDLETILDIYLILEDEGLFLAMGGESEDPVRDALLSKDESGRALIYRIVDKLKENERTAKLVTLFTKLTVSIMANELNLDESMQQTYESVKSDINDTLSISKEGKSEEEYIAEVSSSIDTALQNHGITLEKEIVDSMAEYVNENFEGTEELSDEQINDLLISYYDAYLQYMESQEGN